MVSRAVRPALLFFLVAAAACGSEVLPDRGNGQEHPNGGGAGDDAGGPSDGGSGDGGADGGTSADGGIPFGTGGFLAGMSTYLGDPTAGDWVPADLDGDGKLDVVAKLGSWVTAKGGGNGSFALTGVYVAGSAPLDLYASADFDGDGKVDVMGCFGNNGLRVLRGSSTAASGLVDSTSFAFGNSQYLRSCATGDFDGDGKPDVAIGTSSGSVAIGKNDGTKFVAGATSTGLGDVNRLVAFDVDGTNGADLIAVDGNTSTMRLLLGNGDGTFVTKPGVALSTFTTAVVPFREGTQTSIAVLADFNLSVSTLNAGGVVGAAVAINAGTLYTSVAAADLDGDGKMELAATRLFGGIIETFTRDGAAWKVKQTLRPNWLPRNVKFVDWNGDGKLDLSYLGVPPVALTLGYAARAYSCSTSAGVL